MDAVRGTGIAGRSGRRGGGRIETTQERLAACEVIRRCLGPTRRVGYEDGPIKDRPGRPRTPAEFAAEEAHRDVLPKALPSSKGLRSLSHNLSNTCQDWAAPLLRWPGSKRKLIPRIKPLIPPDFARYIEPFAGSACLFFALKPSRAVLNDLNKDLIETYEIVRAHPRLVSRAVNEFHVGDNYYEVRAIPPASLHPILRAARFVYLNRTCFNGIYRTNRRGEFNVPRGRRTGRVPSEAAFYRCSFALRSAELRLGDFGACLGDVGPRDFVYLDPPYATDGRVGYGEYGYGCFSATDIPRLVTCLERIDRVGATFLLSYAAWPNLLSLINKWPPYYHSVRHSVSASASHRAIVDEVLVTNRA